MGDLGSAGGSAHVEGTSQSQGPQHFSMDCQIEGGPMLTMNKQGQTANELLNWFEKAWKAKVAKSPHLWTVLAVNVDGKNDRLKVAQEKIQREEELQRKQKQGAEEEIRRTQAEADLRLQISRGNIEQTARSMREYENSSKFGEALLAEARLSFLQ